MNDTPLPAQGRRYSLSEVARLCEGVHVSTVWRWILQGVGGVKLRSTKVGGRRFVDAQDLSDFHAKLNGNDDRHDDHKQREDDLTTRLNQAGV